MVKKRRKKNPDSFLR